MGSSFTRFQQRGFWARDASLEIWLFLLADESRKLGDLPAWLASAADNWRHQATAGFDGNVSANLDDVVRGQSERLQIILDLAGRTLDRLRHGGETISKETLNSFKVGGEGSTFTEDVSVAVFTDVGEAFVKLLRGEIEWNNETAPTI